MENEHRLGFALLCITLYGYLASGPGSDEAKELNTVGRKRSRPFVRELKRYVSADLGCFSRVGGFDQPPRAIKRSSRHATCTGS